MNRFIDGGLELLCLSRVGLRIMLKSQIHNTEIVLLWQFSGASAFWCQNFSFFSAANKWVGIRQRHHPRRGILFYCLSASLSNVLQFWHKRPTSVLISSASEVQYCILWWQTIPVLANSFSCSDFTHDQVGRWSQKAVFWDWMSRRLTGWLRIVGLSQYSHPLPVSNSY